MGYAGASGSKCVRVSGLGDHLGGLLQWVGVGIWNGSGRCLVARCARRRDVALLGLALQGALMHPLVGLFCRSATLA